MYYYVITRTLLYLLGFLSLVPSHVEPPSQTTRRLAARTHNEGNIFIGRVQSRLRISMHLEWGLSRRVGLGWLAKETYIL